MRDGSLVLEDLLRDWTVAFFVKALMTRKKFEVSLWRLEGLLAAVTARPRSLP